MDRNEEYEPANLFNCDVWVPCAECNGATHRVFAGDGITTTSPWWVCRDEIKEVRGGEDVEVIYISKGETQKC